MSRALVAFAVLIAAAAWSVAGASGNESGKAAPAKSVEFEDARGEDPNGVDIAAVTVSNGDAIWQHEGEMLPRASRVVTFRVDVPNRAQFTQDMRVAVWIDADSNRVTGLSGPNVPLVGADFLINWDEKHKNGASLLRCSGEQCRTAAAKLDYAYANGATLRALAADLGNTDGFRFLVLVNAGIVYDSTGGIDLTNASADYAPTQGRAWSYRLLIRPTRLLVKPLAASAARAGRPFGIAVTAMRDDTRAAVASGRVLCRASVAGVRLDPSSQRLVRGRAACMFGLPERSAGKTVRGTVTVVAHGLRTTRAFARTIR
jgi:hypothetical protein